MLNKSICTNYRSRDNNSTASSMGKYSIGLFEAISKPQACIKFGFSSKFPFWSRNFPKTIPFLWRMNFRPRMKSWSTNFDIVSPLLTSLFFCSIAVRKCTFTSQVLRSISWWATRQSTRSTSLRRKVSSWKPFLTSILNIKSFVPCFL